MFTKAIYGITPSGTKSITANGNYDVTNYATASVSVSGSLSSTLLWQNNNPSASISEYFNCPFSSSSSNYKYIEIRYKNLASDNNSNYISIIISPSMIKYNNGLRGNVCGLTGTTTYSTCTRYCEYMNSGNGLSFSATCYTYGSSQDNPDRCIPIAIYGLN